VNCKDVKGSDLNYLDPQVAYSAGNMRQTDRQTDRQANRHGRAREVFFSHSTAWRTPERSLKETRTVWTNINVDHERVHSLTCEHDNELSASEKGAEIQNDH
jgi:hypothetical protein